MQSYSAREKLHTPGFTFMELMVVILILGVLMGVGVPAYFRFAETGRENATKASLSALSQAIKMYQLQVGSYPKRLDELINRPKGDAAKKWRGPYLEKEKIPTDGWGADLMYKLTPGKKHPYELFSYGKGGPEGGTPEERISVWD